MIPEEAAESRTALDEGGRSFEHIARDFAKAVGTLCSDPVRGHVDDVSQQLRETLAAKQTEHIIVAIAGFLACIRKRTKHRVEPLVIAFDRACGIERSVQ